MTLCKPGRGRTGTRAAIAGPLAAATILLAACGAAPARPLVAVALPPFDDPVAAATDPTPSPTASAPPATDFSGGGTGSGVASGTSAPRYPLVDRLDAPTVNVHVPVVAVGIVRGAMEAPEGPLGSAFWREGFWLRQGAVPGTPGTATIAGHLDDTAGRPAAFWNIRDLHTGDEVTITRLSDGAVLRYRIVETDVWSLAQANSRTNIARIYGTGGSTDGISRLTLITCTGRWTGTEYDHRFVAFAVLET